ncbi:hypothetical protein HHX48_05045 [Salinimonas sp. HHU 13199]|uniref:DUF1648 domain-containing protein n=1 Tax=Salinimonas profundi TaxID=2729140 RepID=A0ABR8LMF1_9ALTE|nr:hypothetical protein [Salinimonas profundi]MBD3585099.1 hypothetical protein [Salinimonas profundi]
MNQLKYKDKSGQPVNRRSTPRENDSLYKIVMVVNVLAWGLLVAAFVVFHFARPDFIAGVQRFWNIPGQTDWSREHVGTLFFLVKACLILTLSTMLLRIRRNRRQGDNYGINLYVLTVVGLLTLLVMTLSFT